MYLSEQTQISVLRFPENVRKRKEMYIYDPDHCVFEIIDNAIDEHSAGHCDSIAVLIEDDTVTIEDNGRGIPIAPHSDPEYKGKSQVEVAMTVLHSGGKFGDSAKDSYQTVTSGLNGVGASCVNALSESMHITVYKGDKAYGIDFERGKTKKSLYEDNDKSTGSTGTLVKFKLDKEIWGEEKIDIKRIEKRLRQLAYLNPGLTIHILLKDTEENIEIKDSFCYEDGLQAYLEKLSKNKAKITNIYSHYIKREDFELALAFCYVDSFSDEVFTFANNVNTQQGGDHQTGFKMGMSKAIFDFIKEQNLNKKNFDLQSDDIREGLIAVVSVKVKDPKFEGQGKSKLKMTNIRTPIKNEVESFIFEELSKNIDEGKKIAEKVFLAAKARVSAKKARELDRNKSELFDRTGLPGKLADCQTKKPEESEIFILEGDSAGGSACEARDRRTQAVLPVFGKILNVEKARVSKVISNPKLQDLIKALRCGIDDSFDIKKLRYHKIILLADADVDGFHIQCLNLTLFFRHLRPLIDEGHLYLAVPPLYAIKKNKKIEYAYTDQEMRKKATKDAHITKFKGIGEMDPDQLWETTMNPETRKLIQVTAEDIEAAESAFTVCMGENVELRRKFIVEKKIS